jgi:hypothetical protein
MSSLLIAPIEALTDARLTDPERRVLLALFSFRGKDTNTVWPALPALGKVALVNDPARVSKLTSSLAQKGWLTKRKKGFTGCNEYHLTVPPEASAEHAETIAHDANLAPETKLAGNTNTNLASETKSNLVPDAKCNEQTIEHTSEHKTPPVSPPRGARTGAPFDLLTPPIGVDRDAWADWIAHRRKRRKPVSERAAVEQWRALACLSPPQQAACIAHSIRNDYQGLFPEKFANATDRPVRNPSEDRSAAGRVRANVARDRAARAAAVAGGNGLAADGLDVRPPLDVEFRRLG